MTESETERLLQSLKPSVPPPSLEARIAADLELDQEWVKRPAPARAMNWWSASGWASIGAVAAVVVVSLWPVPPKTAPALAKGAEQTTAASDMVPVSTIREWVDAEDQGIQWNAEQAPERRVRLTSMERQTWIDPRDGAEIIVEQPRHETVLLPVSFQ